MTVDPTDQDRRLLARLYDPLEADRGDLDPYRDRAVALGAREVLDIGCGTGVLALILADLGMRVVGVDPDRDAVDVARAKVGADRIRWVVGDAGDVPGGGWADFAALTANVAQAILTDAGWGRTLAGAAAALRPGGELMFETRVPARRAWLDWTPARTSTTAQVPGLGTVTGWVEFLADRWPLIEFADVVRLPGGREIRRRNLLRFRERAEVERDLAGHGFELDEVRDAPDRPGREFVFLARRR